jgi:hypothetical protein
MSSTIRRATLRITRLSSTTRQVLTAVHPPVPGAEHRLG